MIIPGSGERKQAVSRPATQSGKGKESGTEIIERHMHVYVTHENMVAFIDKRGTGGSCDTPYD